MSSSLYPELPTTSDEIPTQLAAMATLGSSIFRSRIKDDKPVTIKLDNIKQFDWSGKLYYLGIDNEISLERDEDL